MNTKNSDYLNIISNEKILTNHELENIILNYKKISKLQQKKRLQKFVKQIKRWPEFVCVYAIPIMPKKESGG